MGGSLQSLTRHKQPIFLFQILLSEDSMISGVVQHIYLTERLRFFSCFVNRISLVMESCLCSQLPPVQCGIKNREMQRECLHSFSTPVAAVSIPFDCDLSGIPFHGWASGLHISERKLHGNLFLEVHTTEIGPTVFCHNYPRSSNKYSYRMSID